MKRGINLNAIVFLACILLCACGRQKAETEDGAAADSAKEAADNGGVAETGYEGGAGAADNNGAAGAADAGITVADSVYTCGEMTVSIPESWMGKVNVIETEKGFYFVQKVSAERAPESGFLCGFYRTDEMVFNFAGERPLARAGGRLYYVQEPTDVSCYEEPAVMDEYGALMESLSRVENSFAVDASDVRYARGEYMLFGSDAVEIEKEYLVNMNLYELWMARNEIFARHGVRFDNDCLQGYFDTCSWYQGVTEGKSFDDSILSETEKKNIRMIQEMEQQKKEKDPYPVRYEAAQTANEDLDGDGQKESISITFRDTSGEGYPQAFLKIDGKEYDLERMGAALIDANTEEFYVTDIWSWIAGLEVAVMDFGPSNDFVTHFFRYDGDLVYLGAIEGFPFKKYMGFDGFYMDGAICSVIRADVISSAYAYGMWWADSTTDTISLNGGPYRMLSDGPHWLLMDLPVYERMDAGADTFVMKAQETVYFVETDRQEWVGVKSKRDGTVGYIHQQDGMIDLVNQSPDAVFSDLRYFD